MTARSRLPHHFCRKNATNFSMLCSSSAPLVTRGMQPMTTLEASMLGGDAAPEEARLATTMAICDRGTWLSRMNLAAAMVAVDEALFTEPMTRRVLSSSNVKTAEDA